MKIHLHLIRRAAHLAMAVLAIAAAASVSAQTLITPDLKAPPSAYDLSKAGMVLRAHQVNLTRTPGEQNSIENVQKQLAGGFGPSLSGATSGPLTGGLWQADYLNHALDPNNPVDFDPDWYTFGAFNLPFPGIVTDPNVVSVSTFAYEIITFLNLPAGINTLVVGSGDSFRLTLGAGDNPYSFSAVQPANGVFSGSRVYATNAITLNVQSAGVYPVRLLYGQGGGTAGLQFYSLADWGTPGFPYLVPTLINDPYGSGYQLTSYQPASLPITPGLAYVSLLSPVPGSAGVSPQPTVSAQLTAGATTTVDTNTISLSFDSVSVSASITQTGAVTYVSYTVPGFLTPLSTHTATLVAQDSAANVLSNQWSFTVGTFTTVPASWAYPAGSGDAAMPGFTGRIHQMEAGAFISGSIAVINSQLNGELINPGTGVPYVNMVVTNGNPIVGPGWNGVQPVDAGGGPGAARTFTVTNAINYSILDGFGTLADIGVFTSLNGKPDALWPGLPGSTDATFATYDNAVEVAAEFIGWVELPAGLQELGVNCDDNFQLAIGGNDARDIFRQNLISNEGDRGGVTTRSTVFVETNGIYSFRLIYRGFRNNLPNALEFFRYDPANPSQPVLVNDTGVGAVKSYRMVTVPTRTYVKSATPAPNASGVAPNAPISVVIVNPDSTAPVLKVNGTAVATTAVTNGNEVTLTHTPPTPLSGEVACEISYGGLVGQWTYLVRTGQKALLIVSSAPGNSAEAAVAQRLATVHGLDVEILSSGLLNADAATLSYASNKALVLVSSTIGSSSSRAWLRSCVTNNIPVPIICWEYANGADIALTEGSNGGGQGGTQVYITNAPAYLTAGFTNGQVVTTHDPTGGLMNCPAAPGTIIAAYGAAGTGNPVLVGAPVGLVVNSTALGSVTHASRKVFWGLADNTSAENLTADGWALFDATVTWLLPPKLTATKGPGAGQLSLSWTPDGTLQTATSLTAPVWGNAPSQANPQPVNTTDPQRYYRVKQ